MSRRQMGLCIELSRHMGLVIWRPAKVGVVNGPKMKGDVETALMVGRVVVESPLTARVRELFT